ncbi:hypothetical protein RHGRI_038966 [Rhododendron griersonianum]|uniref:Uncharacterized protein n=1 Tax=Rhododendron griersonianum TaxID=479676 RepID=A0AAV6HKX6_9ERIC|nr:hypothetical protein RHGRI_038966 [Rhododendron griersonianum]
MSDDKTAFNDYLEKVRHDSEKIFNLFSRARIYKVPEGLRKLNESAYIPRIIAIGPLHRNEKHLQTPMRGIKRHYINCLFDRLTKDSVTKSSLLEQCLNKMKEKKFVGEVKEFYAKEFTVNDDDLLNKTNEKEFVDKANKYYTEEVAVNDAAKLNKTKEKEFVDKAKKYYDKEVMMTVNDDDILSLFASAKKAMAHEL